MVEEKKKQKHKSSRERKVKWLAKAKKEEQKKNATNKENREEQKQSSFHDEGGLVLVEKIFEPLDAILQAYEARLKANWKTMKEWAEEYPDPAEQKRLLGLFTRIVEVTQSLLEQQEKDKKE